MSSLHALIPTRLTFLFGLFQRNFESYYDEGLLMKINHLILTLPGNLLRRPIIMHK